MPAKRLWVVIGAVLVVAGIVLIVIDRLNDPDDAGESSAATVVAKDVAYDPDTVHVSAGETLSFRNEDNTTHTLTADDGQFDTGEVPAGGASVIVIAGPGPISFHCEIHASMTGTVDVDD
jgi:plastocyanin